MWLNRQRYHAILARLDALGDNMATVQEQLTALTAAVQANTTVEEGAIALLNQIPQLIKDAAAGADPTTAASIQAAIDAISAESTKLAAAVSANTPAAPAAPTA